MSSGETYPRAGEMLTCAGKLSARDRLHPDPTASIRIPEIKKLPTRYQSPRSKDFVFAANNPTIKGPTNPPRFPTELIIPIDAAAADSLSNSVGIAQNAG